MAGRRNFGKVLNKKGSKILSYIDYNELRAPQLAGVYKIENKFTLVGYGVRIPIERSILNGS